MTHQQYLKKHPSPTTVTAGELAGRGIKISSDALKEAKRAEVLRRVTKDMPPDKMAEALGVAPTSFRRLFVRVTGMTLTEYRGKPLVAINTKPRAEWHERLWHIQGHSWYKNGNEITPGELTGVMSEIKISHARSLLELAEAKGWVRQTRPGVYARVPACQSYMRMPWVKGEAARLIELERQRELEEWAA